MCLNVSGYYCQVVVLEKDALKMELMDRKTKP